MSQREAARHFGISRDSVRKMLSSSVPPAYRRSAPVRRPKLNCFTEIIEQWLRDDLGQSTNQRLTAKRVFERLRDEHGFVGGYTIVKDYVREHRRRGREMFVPLHHPPGQAQADFGEAAVVIGGVEQTAHFFAFDLPQSDACFVRAYPAATAEAWVDGHVLAFAFFGRVPQSMLYDNDRCLVARILPDGTLASAGSIPTCRFSRPGHVAGRIMAAASSLRSGPPAATRRSNTYAADSARPFEQSGGTGVGRRSRSVRYRTKSAPFSTIDPARRGPGVPTKDASPPLEWANIPPDRWEGRDEAHTAITWSGRSLGGTCHGGRRPSGSDVLTRSTALTCRRMNAEAPARSAAFAELALHLRGFQVRCPWHLHVDNTRARSLGFEPTIRTVHQAVKERLM